jgi:acetyl-CoA synthetase
MSEIKTLRKEALRFKASEEFIKNAHIKSEEEYNKLYKQSIQDPETFWKEVSKNITWFKDFEKVFEWDNFEEKKFTWFKNGKLNACYNALDRHIQDKGEQTALIFQGEAEEDVKKYTFKELLKEVSRFANVLKKKGIKKGDRVSIYLPMIPELLISSLACARIGAIHSVVFAGFSADALVDRIEHSQCRLLITCDGSFRAGKKISFKENIDKVIEKSKSLEGIILVKRINDSSLTLKEGFEFLWSEEISKSDISDNCPCEEMDSKDPLFILFTSGTTGKPKGIVHSTGGYLTYVNYTFKTVFDYKEKEVFWCTADIGWITGHSYLIYGPLTNGATTVMFESVPTYPDAGRFWKIVEKFNVNIFYTAPTVIRLLKKSGNDYVKKHNLSSLRVLGSVGEPINTDAWVWYYEVVGDKKCPIVDTWWQTETGGFMLAPIPGAFTLKPGSANKPFFGVIPKIIKEDGQFAKENEGGHLVFEKPWPGMMMSVYGDHERYLKTYWREVEGFYASGDGARMDEDGDFFLLGRIDDVINVSGHRLGTAEIEATIASFDKVSEAAAVPFPHEIKGQAVYAYVVLQDNVIASDALVLEIKNHVAKKIGPIAKPDKIQFVSSLPKTRSGKIMRRILKAIAEGKEDVGNTTTLLDPTVVDVIKRERIL